MAVIPQFVDKLSLLMHFVKLEIIRNSFDILEGF